MEYFNAKSGKILTKYKTTLHLNKLFNILLYLYTSCIIRQLLIHVKYYHVIGNVNINPINPTIYKLSQLYSFWINYRHVNLIDNFINAHYVMNQEEMSIFKHLEFTCTLLDEYANIKFLRIHYNLDISEILMHSYLKFPTNHFLNIPKTFTNNKSKIKCIYELKTFLVHVLQPSLTSLCDTCQHCEIPSYCFYR